MVMGVCSCIRFFFVCKEGFIFQMEITRRAERRNSSTNLRRHTPIAV